MQNTEEINKKGLDNCQDPNIKYVKDKLFLQFATYTTNSFRCDLQERGYLF